MNIRTPQAKTPSLTGWLKECGMHDVQFVGVNMYPVGATLQDIKRTPPDGTFAAAGAWYINPLHGHREYIYLTADMRDLPLPEGTDRFRHVFVDQEGQAWYVSGWSEPQEFSDLLTPFGHFVMMTRYDAVIPTSRSRIEILLNPRKAAKGWK